MLHIDVNFANRISPYVRNFKYKGDHKWNFSCPFCGDSKKNERAARGNLFRDKKDRSKILYKCFNCGKSTNLPELIKFLDERMFYEYNFESYKAGGSDRPYSKPPSELAKVLETPKVDNILKSLVSIDKMDIAHPAVRYVLGRKIPRAKWKYLYFCPRYKKYVNGVMKQLGKPNAVSEKTPEHPRLIIPYFNKDGKVFMFTARAFGPEEPKYLHTKIDENEERIYGLDRIDHSKRIYVVEGQIDSLFIRNCVAVSGSGYDNRTIRQLINNVTIIPDNERRSPIITNIIGNCIDLGYSVCLWPDTIREKDINAMIKDGGRTIEQVMDIIHENTFSGMEAKLQFASWKKR